MLGSSNVSAILGTRPELEYIIAIDSDGSKLQQGSVLNMVTFFFNNSVNSTSLLQLTESNEFQHYSYVLPVIDNSSVGEYLLTSGKKFFVVSHTII